MSISQIDQYDDIQKIQSFIIIITSPSKHSEQIPQDQRSKILSQKVLEDLQDKEKKDEHNNVLQNSIKNGRTEMANIALKKIQYKTRLNENVQKYAQVKEKCELLINHSPYKIRHSSTGCLRKGDPTQKSQLKILNYHKTKDNQIGRGYREQKMVPFEQRSFVNLPQLKVNPYELNLRCNNTFEKFYLFKTIKSKENYSLYLAQNEKNKTIYTLKIINKANIKNKQIQSLIKQLKIQTFLAHVNLIKIIHITYDKHFFYIFYEPSMVANLGDQIKEGEPLFERQVRRIIKQICLAVDYMQRNSIIHQNIKPQSIYFQQGIVKLGNFDRAQHVSPHLSLKSKSQGSLKWSLPQYSSIDIKIDVWNIGILTYELLFGRPPIEYQERLKQNNIMKQSLYFYEQVDVSNTAKEFILACLERNHAKRKGIKQIMEHGFLRGGEKYRWTTA